MRPEPDPGEEGKRRDLGVDALGELRANRQCENDKKPVPIAGETSLARYEHMNASVMRQMRGGIWPPAHSLPRSSTWSPFRAADQE